MNSSNSHLYLKAWVLQSVSREMRALVPEELFIIVHSIDGLALRNTTAQLVLPSFACGDAVRRQKDSQSKAGMENRCLLAWLLYHKYACWLQSTMLMHHFVPSPYLHIMATSTAAEDEPTRVILPVWNHIMVGQFNWIWHDTTTFDPYICEGEANFALKSFGKTEVQCM